MVDAVNQLQNDSFLLTPLREGRRFGTQASFAMEIYFYSRPCGRGDMNKVHHHIIKILISTHAPAGGATRIVSNSTDKTTISTHAPAGGATLYRNHLRMDIRLFLLTPLREGRLKQSDSYKGKEETFLLTPLREGRQQFSTSPS